MTAFLHISSGWDIPVVVNTGDKVEVYNRVNSEDPIKVRASRSGETASTIKPNKAVVLKEVGTHFLSCDGHADLKLIGGQY